MTPDPMALARLQAAHALLDRAGAEYDRARRAEVVAMAQLRHARREVQAALEALGEALPTPQRMWLADEEMEAHDVQA